MKLSFQLREGFWDITHKIVILLRNDAFRTMSVSFHHSAPVTEDNSKPQGVYPSLVGFGLQYWGSIFICIIYKIFISCNISEQEPGVLFLGGFSTPVWQPVSRSRAKGRRCLITRGKSDDPIWQLLSRRGITLLSIVDVSLICWKLKKSYWRDERRKNMKE